MSKKKKKVDRAAGEVALEYTRLHEKAAQKIGLSCSPAALKVYIYLNFNCNLASGITHRLKKRDIANYWKMDSRTVRTALVELERIQVDDDVAFEFTQDGDFVGVIPHQRKIQQYVHAKSHEDKEREFYEELQGVISADQRERGKQLSFGQITCLYSDLITVRSNAKEFYPKAKGAAHIVDKLKYYCPDDDD